MKDCWTSAHRWDLFVSSVKLLQVAHHHHVYQKLQVFSADWNLRLDSSGFCYLFFHESIYLIHYFVIFFRWNLGVYSLSTPCGKQYSSCSIPGLMTLQWSQVWTGSDEQWWKHDTRIDRLIFYPVRNHRNIVTSFHTALSPDFPVPLWR